MIEAEHLGKRYGDTLAVDDLSFQVRPGHVTGFLGPNGAGKSTTMRMILGLDEPTSGQVRIAGRRYRDLRWPLHEVGGLLDANAVHGGRTAYRHLLALAQSNRIGRRRATEVLGMVGLDSVAGKRIRGFSLGMKQRLGIATALLGDPRLLLFDEPVNGLDPEGIRWLRHLLAGLAAEGRAVFVSSHLINEVARIADRVVVIGRGRLIADTSVADMVERSQSAAVRVLSPQAGALTQLLTEHGGRVHPDEDGGLIVAGLDAATIGDLAAGRHLTLHGLTPHDVTLEDVFMTLTADSVDYHAGTETENSHGN